MIIAGYPIHPAADLFPILCDKEIESLGEDIRINGLRHDIVLTQTGEVLDGRNRLLACKKVGVKPTFSVLPNEHDLISWVLSTNLHRRHLTESQRAMVAARASAMYANAAQERMLRGKSIGILENKGKSSTAAAKVLNVSTRSVEYGIKILKSGIPELVKSVDSGKIKINNAATIAVLGKEQQLTTLTKGQYAIVNAAKKIRADRSITLRALAEEKKKRLAQRNIPLNSVETKYNLLLIDPPWRYDRQTPRGELDAIERHYPTMSFQEIRDLPISDVATDNAILFLWVPNPKLAEAFQIISAWGWEYKTCMTWTKDRIGLGTWVRSQSEQLLIATKGFPSPPATNERPSSIFSAKREQHSKKPEVIYSILNQAFPTLTKLELFAREKHQGFEAWGNQAPKNS